MASPVPKSVTAAIGLVPTVLDGVRRLPGKAVQLPVIAVSSALAGLDLARREYDDLSDRGERLVAKLRGTSFDEVEDRIEDRLQGTPVAGVYDRAEDALEDLGGAVGGVVTKAAGKQAKDRKEASRAVEAVQQTLPVADLPAAERPKGAPTPKATEPDATRIDTAATPAVVQAVEQIAGSTAAPSADDLPLSDYDHMTLGALRGRLRSLDVDQLVALRAYEKSKADRLPVVTMLDHRIAKLAAGGGTPTGSRPDVPSAKAAAAVKPPKKVGRAAKAKTDAPPHTKVRTT